MTIAVYTLGAARRPAIRHDNGFLDKYARRAPTVADHLQKQWWVGKLEAAEAAQNVPFLPHNDISDALATYRHFLEGGGKTRRFSYDRYIANDPSGKTALRYAVFDVQLAAVQAYQRHHSGQQAAHFSLTGTAIPVGNSARFPYPQTENWQKAIGAHFIWLSAQVQVHLQHTQARYTVDMTLHAEDMYNFNPGAKDIATGIPDDANGVFEITGLAQQYLNVAELRRSFQWAGSPQEEGVLTTRNDGHRGRDRQPGDNRRLRNRL
jgi:hypothetical protein